MSKVEIICQNCKQETLLKREPIYNGFNKIGIKLSCTGCGIVFENEKDIMFKKSSTKKIIFTDEDYSKNVKIFDKNENNELCRYCASYIVNPFTQYCSVHKKEVQATDSCDEFKKSSSKKIDDLF